MTMTITTTITSMTTTMSLPWECSRSSSSAPPWPASPSPSSPPPSRPPKTSTSTSPKLQSRKHHQLEKFKTDIIFCNLQIGMAGTKVVTKILEQNLKWSRCSPPRRRCKDDLFLTQVFGPCTWCGHTLQSTLNTSVSQLGKASKKKSIFLGNSPEQRTPPNPPYGLGLT